MYHFISGLPRSGSTLLASILSQNSSVHASIISPLGAMVPALRRAMSPEQETHIRVSAHQRLRVMEAIFDAYYEEVLDKIIFDTNRRWCADIALITKLFPNSRVLACVRNPALVIDSFERAFQKNPVNLSTIIRCDPHGTVYDRVPVMMANDGVVGYAYNALRQAFYGPHSGRLVLVEYTNLATAPKETMAWIHAQLEFGHFDYDFDHIKQIPGAEAFDNSIGTPSLHMLKEKVEYVPGPMSLPPDIVSRLPPAFWRPSPPVKEAETNPS